MDEKLSDHPPTPKSVFVMDHDELLLEVVSLRAKLARTTEKREARLPKLTTRSVARYVAAVTSALAAGEIEPAAARACLYAAQLMLSFRAK